MSGYDQVKPHNIAKEMRTSFIDYAMSVIVSRALPDVRDGLKPVHRRILYSMNDLGMHSDKPYKKSARIVGDVIAKYHPHGDSSVYDAMVRMAQDFSYRYPLVDGHGNFGSIDGDGAAAMRYTEARMSKLAMEMMRDINKNTIDFQPNFDGEEQEPVVLPARFPSLLVNGTTGIAVGMATNIPPHNLSEVIDGCLAYMDNPEIDILGLMQFIKGPDLPTGALILGTKGIRSAYETGNGSIMIRSQCEIVEGHGGKYSILVTEIPYQVNRERLIEKIAELVKEKRLDGITDLRNESNREGTRIVIELRKDVNPQVMLNNLFKLTQLQVSYGINMLALVDGQPKVLNLKEIISEYIKHQVEVIVRRTKFDLDKAEDRAHILEGLRIALDHIDRIIAIIRGSSNDEEALNSLMSEFSLSERQGKAILEMRLRRLTGLERGKIEDEYQNLVVLIADLKDILANESRVHAIIREELLEVKQKHGDERRTQIVRGSDFDIEDEDLIPEEQVIITLTNNGYIKRQPISTYRSQNRGGRGVQGMGTHDDDYVKELLSTSTHDHLLFFTSKGKVYQKKAYTIPEYGRTAKGLPIVNIIEIAQDEYISAIIPVKEFNDDEFLFFATRFGVVKRTTLSAFGHIRTNGLIALSLREDDELIGVRKTSGQDDIIIASSGGKAVWFDETEVRPMGRTAAGVRGIFLEEDEVAIGMEMVTTDQEILVVTENGFGKRTSIKEYRKTKRGGKGVKTLTITDKNGTLVAMKAVNGDEDLIIVTNKGVIIRTPIQQISQTGRATQGVKLIRLTDEQLVSSVAIVEHEESDESQLVSEEVQKVAEGAELDNKPESE
ncbi:MAG: DNA gyrase subunit A [Turicibacter sp.]|jgi:DNA gyrase subunit A|uniref:DNA gyrase subunit A n=1 Tax=Turicibacter faecis TaxID=2963365 RepID=A0ABN6ZMD8_9FIRM|nr:MULTISPECIES: DNA gyrase subunit A [unclassified Turicibacter]MCI8701420.1 DNA gyrase subunit A [Turicibacter sp.]BEH92058.1 DNA gyrase subunit A [Turicibacter sp. TC023]MCU7204754.1 DNA gyrase subunit A [Turicibacter sp. TA25]MCU7209552.1 DNA gyrase subunit A [Turicibacter sp. 1E2]NCE78010.1 DNA gyrase subunit A [Turicibacter sp. TS3]